MALDPKQVEFAVLVEVIELQPDRLTSAELVRRLSGERDEGAALRSAIRRLKGSGLLHCADGVIAPTDAAVHAHELLTL